jgi:hypothetical protein
MALRIAVGVYAALRAVLIYGEAAWLATQPAYPPRMTGPRTLAPDSGRRRPPVLDREVVSLRQVNARTAGGANEARLSRWRFLP